MKKLCLWFIVGFVAYELLLKSKTPALPTPTQETVYA